MLSFEYFWNIMENGAFATKEQMFHNIFNYYTSREFPIQKFHRLTTDIL